MKRYLTVFIIALAMLGITARLIQKISLLSKV